MEHTKFRQNSFSYTKKKSNLYPIFSKSNFFEKEEQKIPHNQEFMLKDNATKKDTFVKHFSHLTAKI